MCTAGCRAAGPFRQELSALFCFSHPGPTAFSATTLHGVVSERNDCRTSQISFPTTLVAVIPPFISLLISAGLNQNRWPEKRLFGWRKGLLIARFNEGARRDCRALGKGRRASAQSCLCCAGSVLAQSSGADPQCCWWLGWAAGRVLGAVLWDGAESCISVCSRAVLPWRGTEIASDSSPTKNKPGSHRGLRSWRKALRCYSTRFRFPPCGHAAVWG